MAGPKSSAVRFSLVGLALVTLGILFLLHNLNVVSWDIWVELWAFWPVLLVIIGLNLLWGVTRPALVLVASLVLLIGSVAAAAFIAGRPTDTEPTNYSQGLSGITRAEATVTFGAGNLTIGQLPEESDNLVESTAEPDMRHDFSISNSTGILSLNVPAGNVSGPLRISLDARFSQSIPTKLTVKTGASHVDIDLTDMKVSDLAVDIGASRLALTLPADARTVKASIKAGAASINITVPQNIPARIQISAGLSSIHVDSRFLKSGTVYQSPDYSDSAANKIDLTVSAGVSSININ